MHGRKNVSEIHGHTPEYYRFRAFAASSQSLQKLRGSSVPEKQGMNVRYWISDTRVIALIESIKEQYCKEETL